MVVMSWLFASRMSSTVRLSRPVDPRVSVRLLRWSTRSFSDAGSCVSALSTAGC